MLPGLRQKKGSRAPVGFRDDPELRARAELVRGLQTPAVWPLMGVLSPHDLPCLQMRGIVWPIPDSLNFTINDSQAPHPLLQIPSCHEFAVIFDKYENALRVTRWRGACL